MENAIINHLSSLVQIFGVRNQSKRTRGANTGLSKAAPWSQPLLVGADLRCTICTARRDRIFEHHIRTPYFCRCAVSYMLALILFPATKLVLALVYPISRHLVNVPSNWNHSNHLGTSKGRQVASTTLCTSRPVTTQRRRSARGCCTSVLH